MFLLDTKVLDNGQIVSVYNYLKKNGIFWLFMVYRTLILIFLFIMILRRTTFDITYQQRSPTPLPVYTSTSYPYLNVETFYLLQAL